MSKKSTKLEALSEEINITVDEMKRLEVENIDQMFLEIYTEQASLLTDTRQQEVGVNQEMCFVHAFILVRVSFHMEIWKELNYNFS